MTLLGGGGEGRRQRTHVELDFLDLLHHSYVYHIIHTIARRDKRLGVV